jgi:hypothetical protein
MFEPTTQASTYITGRPMQYRKVHYQDAELAMKRAFVAHSCRTAADRGRRHRSQSARKRRWLSNFTTTSWLSLIPARDPINLLAFVGRT